MSLIKKHLFVAACLAACWQPTGAVAQGGAILDDPVAEAMPLLDTSEVKAAILPRRARVVSRPFAPGDQGALNSCCGWALRHQVMLQREVDRKPVEDLSASFVYDLLVVHLQNCQAGAFLASGVRLLDSIGICPASIFPNSKLNCKPPPGKDEQAAARPYSILEYNKLFNPGTDSSFKVNATRYSVVYRQPVAFSMAVTENYEEYRCQPLWKPEGKTNDELGHAAVVIGYEDDLAKKGSGWFELMNSYGPDCGAGGIVRVSYADFARLAWYGFVITL